MLIDYKFSNFRQHIVQLIGESKSNKCKCALNFEIAGLVFFMTYLYDSGCRRKVSGWSDCSLSSSSLSFPQSSLLSSVKMPAQAKKPMPKKKTPEVYHASVKGGELDNLTLMSDRYQAARDPQESWRFAYQCHEGRYKTPAALVVQTPLCTGTLPSVLQ